MQSKTSITTKRLLNLYRQHHVIYGGWSAINPVFVQDADDNVLQELKTLPTGSKLVKHIENLRSGKTPMDSIDKDLLPYGRLMADSETIINLSSDETNQIKTAVNEFTPDKAGLEKIQSLPVIKKLGTEWLAEIKPYLIDDKALLEKYEMLSKTHRAYQLWNLGQEIVSSPITNKTRATIQAELPEFEMYLPMFGESGKSLLEKLKQIVSNN